MEAVTANFSNAHANAPLTQSPTDERKGVNDPASGERTESPADPAQTAGNHVQLSEAALKLSSTFQNPATVSPHSAINNGSQAQQAINDLRAAIQNSPELAGAAQSNLTSNVVKSLLG